MTYNRNNPSAVETQGANNIRKRYVLTSGDVIKGLIQPSGVQPTGIMLVGPFDQNIWTIKYEEMAEVASQVIMAATYNLDSLEMYISSTTPLAPYIAYTDATPTWETVATTTVAKKGSTSFIVNWSTAGLSKNLVPSAVRFYFGTGGTTVKIEIEEGVL